MKIKTNDLVNDYGLMLSEKLSDEQTETAKDVLRIVLSDYEIISKRTELAVSEDNAKAKAIQMFFVSKKIEGCTNQTISYYSTILRKFFSEINMELDKITADQVRYYIAKLSLNGLSKCSQDNELRVLKSFFKWAFGEGYISKIPTLNIKTIKQEKRIKKSFTELQIEQMRKVLNNKGSLRDIAIFETLNSTGVRVSELNRMNINDIQDDEITVFGKGEKERIVYLNTKSKLAIQDYLKSRNDNEEALFISSKSPYTRLSKGAIETMIRNLGKEAGVDKAHPHRFRRTSATFALNRGMPIEQDQQMLGHENISTTTIYARSEKENVKASHRKYVV